MKLLSILFFGLASMACSAASTHLATVTSDTDSNRHELILETDVNNVIESLRVVQFNSEGKKGKLQQFFSQDLLSGGLVMMEKEGHQVVRLDSAKFAIEKGGNVILNFLSNGLSGRRNSVWLSLYFKNGSYRLYDMKNNQVNEIKFFGKYWFGRLVGIGGVDFMFNQSSYKQIAELD